MKSNGIEKRKMTSEREILRSGMGGKHILTWSELWGAIWENKGVPHKNRTVMQTDRKRIVRLVKVN